VMDIMTRQIRKNKTRLEKRIKTGSLNDIIADIPEGEIEAEDEYKVVRAKQVIVKPLTIEEAILEMNMVNHDFFMFLNAETNDINVVYKRKDGNYGVLEPS
ncbi:MAG: sigma 54 modulation/S30EA ribosomal C-terminal domain-containing protein, partial [Ruminococcus sp.]|nr:sigma 54 modulation/S30EA ribosomal C-terminal domain-containing protein [Ruminococcus sp.]